MVISAGDGAKPVSPERNLGIFKTIADVPPHDRLSWFESQYADDGGETWDAFMLYEDPAQEWAKTTRRRYERTGRYWKGFCEQRGVSYVCAGPEDVEAFLRENAEKVSPKTMYDERFRVVEGFFSFLLRRVDYPHRYNPVVMAACEPGVTRAMWNHRLEITGRDRLVNDSEYEDYATQ